MISIRTFVVGLVGAGLVALACASGPEVQKAERWHSYSGCNAKQCADWADECSAECINAHQASVTECENKCRGKIPSCEESCP